MPKTIERSKGRYIPHTPAAAVSAGDVVVLDDDVVCFAHLDIAADELGDVSRYGHYTVYKDASTITKGQRAFWDADGDPVTGTAGSGAFSNDPTVGPACGWFTEAAATGVDTVGLLLDSETLTSLRRGMTAAIAAAGSAQGDATALVEDALNSVSAADGTKGVVLPLAAAGKRCRVYNEHATNGLKIYPNTSDTINGGSANAAITIEGKTLAIFECYDAVNWTAIFTANS